MRDILVQRRFSESEISILEARDDYEAVQQQVERLGVNTLLDRLEIRTEETVHSLEERWEQLKQDIARIEAEQTQTSSETGETLDALRQRLQTEAISQAEEAVRSKVSWIPIFGERIGNWLIERMQHQVQGEETPNNSWRNFFSNMFFFMATSIFGINGIITGLQNSIQVARNAELPHIEVPEIINPSRAPGAGVEGGLENLNVTNFRYNSGLNTLIFFSDGRNLEGDTHVRNRIFENIKDLPLSEVTSLRSNPERQVQVFGENLDTAGFREGLDILLHSFENAQFLEVCELSLGGDRIEAILAPNEVENRRLFQILGEQRSREIIRLSNVSGFELSSLTMFELSILYSASFPNLAYMSLASSLQLGVNIVDTTSEEFQEMVNSSAPGRILTYIAANGDGSINSLLALESDARFLSDVRAADPEISVEEVQAVIDFKNYIRSEAFQNHPSLRLSGDTLAAFNNNLNYTRVIILYDILKGGRVEAVSPLNFPLLILAISSIIGGNNGDNVRNAGLAEAYKGQFVRSGIVDFFGRENITESERRALEIYGEAFFGLALETWAQRVYGSTRLLESLTGISDETMFGLSTLAIPAGGFIARQGMRRASPMLFRMGGGLRYLGWAGAVIYGGILGYEYFSGDESETERPAPDLPTRDDERYIGHQIDRDLQGAQTPREQMQILGRLHENTHEYMIGDEPITVITYPGDVPHAVYQGRIWEFRSLNSDDLAGDIEGYLVNAIRGIGDDEELNNDSVWTDGERIHVGPSAQNSYSFSINELFPPENNLALGINTVRDLSGAIRNFMDEEFPGHGYEGGQDLGEYIMVMQLPGNDNRFLGLVATPRGQQGTPTS